jgi:hypothetical protein
VEQQQSTVQSGMAISLDFFVEAGTSVGVFGAHDDLGSLPLDQLRAKAETMS